MQADSEPAAPTQRIDQWLWHSRLIKSRSSAARLIEAGAMRVNRQKVRKPGHHIKAGDILVYVNAGRLQVVEVLAVAGRRGPASEAAQLYCSAVREACEQSTHGDQKGDA